MKRLSWLTATRLIVITFIGLGGALSAVQSMDIRSLDILRKNHSPHPDITIIAIDTQSLQSIGRWPWDRSIHAELLQKLQTLNPRAIGIDISFFEPSNETSDTAFAESIALVDAPVILPVEPVVRASDSTELQKPLTSLIQSPNVLMGHVTVQDIIDGRARSIPKRIAEDNQTIPSFAAQLANAIGAQELPDSRLLVNFAGPSGTFPTYSYTDVLRGTIEPGALTDKIFLIGATASNLHDTVLVPLGNGVMSGVEWQANVLDNILLNRPLQLPPVSVMVMIGILTALALTFIFRAVSALKAAAIAAGALIILCVFSYILHTLNIGIPFFWLSLLIVLTFAGDLLERWLTAEQEKRMLRRSLQGYLSPLILEYLLKNPSMLKLGGYRGEITAFFSDIRGFTTISESTDPMVLANLLYEYFTAMTEEVFAGDGVVCQFMGDGLYSFWGAPIAQDDHSERAVRAGIRMMKKLEELRVDWAARGLPYVDIGIGINSGMATIGNLGSAKRFDFTAIGDCVNAAARLESLNKEHKTHILVSQIIADRLPADIKTRFVADIVVKGKTVPLKVYEVMEENWQ